MKTTILNAQATPHGVHLHLSNGRHTSCRYGVPTLNTRLLHRDESPVLNAAVFQAATVRLNCVLPAGFRLSPSA